MGESLWIFKMTRKRKNSRRSPYFSSGESRISSWRRVKRNVLQWDSVKMITCLPSSAQPKRPEQEKSFDAILKMKTKNKQVKQEQVKVEAKASALVEKQCNICRETKACGQECFFCEKGFICVHCTNKGHQLFRCPLCPVFSASSEDLNKMVACPACTHTCLKPQHSAKIRQVCISHFIPESQVCLQCWD